MHHIVEDDESVHLFCSTGGVANAMVAATGRLSFSISTTTSTSKPSNRTAFHFIGGADNTSLTAESDGKRKRYIVRDKSMNLTLSFIMMKRRRHAQLVLDEHASIVVMDVRKSKTDYAVTDGMTGLTAATVTTRYSNGKGVHRVVDVLHSALQSGLGRVGVSEEGLRESGVRAGRWRVMLVTLVTLLADDMFDGWTA